MTTLEARRSIALLSLLFLLLQACSVDVGDASGGLGTALGRSVLCSLDYRQRIAGDQEQVQAVVSCRGGGDCSDRRAVALDSVFDVLVEVPAEHDDGRPLEIESTDPRVLRLEGFDTRVATCEEGPGFEGTVAFEGVGEAALVVRAGGEKIDRFTVSVHERARVEIQVSDTLSLSGGGDYEVVDALQFDRPRMVRAVARAASGERLAGGPAFSWRVADTAVAELVTEPGEPATGRVQWLNPVDLGRTTLEVDSDGLSDIIGLEVTGVPAPQTQASTGAP